MNKIDFKDKEEVDTSVLAPFGRMIMKPQAKWFALAALLSMGIAQYLGY